jgi:hypothetical protein
VLRPKSGQSVKEKMKHQAIAAVREQAAPVNRKVQNLLLALWAANIAFFVYSLLRHGWQQPW